MNDPSEEESYGIGNECTVASKDNDNVLFLSLHSRYMGVYLLLSNMIILKKKNLLDYETTGDSE